MKTLEEKIAVMQAAAEGKEIEFNWPGDKIGWTPTPTPTWDWANCDYRVKPQEPRKLYVVEDKYGFQVVSTRFRREAERQADAHFGHKIVEYLEVVKE